MNKTLIFLMLVSSLQMNSQNQETIDWLNKNAIEIEYANPDSEPLIFEQNTPAKFSNAKIYGFGEASHNTKEFFDLKAKFFKYLVKTEGVRTFIMEDSYQSESGINEWISGGKGDVKTIAENFDVGFWYCKEIVNLLKWMRQYNSDKPKEEQIRFYGMDIQNGKNINLEIREFIKTHKIPIDDELLVTVDSCSNKKIDYSKTTAWAEIHVPKLKKLEKIIVDSPANIKMNQKEFKAVIRSLNYLISYTQYMSNSQGFKTHTELRDLGMFENVKWIIDNEVQEGKAFIWAHNEHINKKEMYSSGSGIINLGRRLKDFYQDLYYSVGFDFGTGRINGYVVDKKEGNHWENYQIEKPFRKTYAATLMSVNKDIFFVDMDKALSEETTNFFNEKRKHLIIGGGGGYQPKPLHKILITKIFAETYDGLIFVKNISVPDYKLDEL